MELRLAQRIASTEAEGPGRRFAIWVQGCTLRCEGCCNPEMFSTAGGAAIDVAALAAEIERTPGIEGISVLGGEPFEQPDALAGLCRRVRAAGLSVMVYTGYALAELRAMKRPPVDALIDACDLLVDGRYERSKPERARRWIGSANQVLHFLSDRYAPGDARFAAPNTVEIRLTREGLTINGWPAAADGLRRR